MKVLAGVVYESGLERPYDRSKPVRVEQVDLEPPRRDEVLVKVAGAGVCHSDLLVVQGVRKLPLPIVLGHECSGIVEEIGAGVQRLKKGDHVVMSYVPSCGRCSYCLRGLPALCDYGRASNKQGSLAEGGTRFSIAGKNLSHHLGVAAFSEYTVVSEQSVISVRKDVPLEKLALFGCAILTGIGAVINSAKVRPGSSVAIFGCGGIGLNVIQGARLVSAGQIIAVDLVPKKLEIAKSFGATDTVNPRDEDAVESIHRLTGGSGVDYAFEATGNTNVMTQAFLSCKKGGETIVIGITSPQDRLTIPSSFLVDEQRTLKGSFMGSVIPRRDVPLLIDLYAAGRIKLDELISRNIKLEEINDGLEALASGEVARQIVKM